MRLIDADELKKNFQDELCKGIACAECSMQAEGFCRVERWIDIAPTIKAVPEEQYQRMVQTAASLTEVVGEMIDTDPIKHGRWIDKAAEDCYRCSVCEEYTHMEMPRLLYHYCPNCGARMDLIGEDKSHPFAESVMMGMDGGENG